MTVNPGAGAIEGPTERMMVAPATLDKLGRAYIATYHGPHGDARPPTMTVTGPMDMSAAGKLMSPDLLAAHYRLGRQRQVGANPRRALRDKTTPPGSVPRCRSSPTTRRC